MPKPLKSTNIKLKDTNPKLLVLIRFILVLISGVTILVSIGGVKAEGVSPRLAVAPHTFELDVFPGEKSRHKIKTFNQSGIAIPMTYRTVDFTAAEESGEMLFEENLEDPSISAKHWIKIENPNFILDPWEREDVEFSIEVPENAEPGGHYAVIFFEPALPSFYFKEDQPRVIPVLGVLFLLSVKTFALEPISEVEQIKIVEFGIPREQRLENLEKALAAAFQIIPGAQAAEMNIVEKTPTSFILRIKNNDIFHHKLEGKLSIYNNFGKRVGESEIKRTTILPGKTRQFPIKFSPETPQKIKWLPASISNFLVQNAPFGKYRVVLDLNEEKSDLELNQVLAFWAFPWKIVVPSLFFLILLILLRKRFIGAFKVLFR